MTVFAAASLDAVTEELGLPTVPDVLATRRNIVVRGYPVDTLAVNGRVGTGAVFGLDSGAGLVRFHAYRPAHPCRWTDHVLALARSGHCANAVVCAARRSTTAG